MSVFVRGQDVTTKHLCIFTLFIRNTDVNTQIMCMKYARFNVLTVTNYRLKNRRRYILTTKERDKFRIHTFENFLYDIKF